MTSLSDGELIEKIRAGEKELFAELVRKYQSPLFTYALRMVFQQEVARDMTQDAFLTAYRKLDSFRGTGTFSAWLYRIITHTCINYLNRSKKISFQPFDEHLEKKIAGRVELEGDPEEECVKKEVIERMSRGLADLPLHQRAVCNLFYLTGLSYREIGEILEESEAKVKSDLFRARKNLRKSMHDLWHR